MHPLPLNDFQRKKMVNRGDNHEGHEEHEELIGISSDSRIHQEIHEVQPLASTKPAIVKTGRLIHSNVTKRKERMERFMR